jgi:DNA-binding HxlR family transcriptional regulator
MKEYDLRSDCPVNFALEIFGDKWSLLIVRDMIFAGKVSYNEFLESEEKIATNILSSRLKMLEEMGIIKKQYDPNRKTKTKYIYELTSMGAGLIPLFVEIMLWSDHHHPETNGPHKVVVEKARRDKQRLIDELCSNVKNHTPMQLT